jgi:hypothetical protein
MNGKAFVDGDLVAEAEMMASIVKRADAKTQAAGGNGTPADVLPRSKPEMN